MSTKPLRYESLVAEFNDNLINTLRSHSSSQEFLTMWVPDEDPVRSLLNMLEAAQAAGRDELALEVSRDSLSSHALAEFRERAEPLGKVEVRETPAVFVLTVSDLRAGKRVEALGPGLDATAAVSAAPAQTSRKAPLRLGRGQTHEVHPVLEHVVSAGAVLHEGDLAEEPGSVLLRAQSDTGRLAVLVDPTTHVVKNARHSGVTLPARRVIIGVVCQAMEGRPLQDASDHAGIYALHRLAGKSGQRGVQGILMPTNAGRAFQEVVTLVREVRNQYAQQHGVRGTENFYEQPASKEWQALDEAGRLKWVAEVVRRYEGSTSLSEGTIAVDRIEPNLLGQDVRVVVGFHPSVAPQEKPRHMRSLERVLKEAVEETLQLHMEILKDFNKIRRL